MPTKDHAHICRSDIEDSLHLSGTWLLLRGLTRDLRQVSDRLQGNPARYLLGRDAPKEFDPK